MPRAPRLASAAPGAAIAARAATANIQRKARAGVKLADEVIGDGDIVIFLLVLAALRWRSLICRTIRLRGSSLPIRPGSAISADFIARLIKGCRVDVRASYLISEIA